MLATLLGAAIGVLNSALHIKINLSDPGLLSLIPLVPAIFTFSPQFISRFPAKTQSRIDWLVKQPGMNQFYQLMAVQIVVLLLLFFLNLLFRNTFLLSVTYGLLISYFMLNSFILLKFVKLFKN